LDGVLDGDRIGLAPLKKLDCLFTEAGEGGILDSVSIVRSDRVRPRVSSAPSTSSSATGLTSSAIGVLFTSLGSFCVDRSSLMTFAGVE
jgi:hypothetical protein